LKEVDALVVQVSKPRANKYKNSVAAGNGDQRINERRMKEGTLTACHHFSHLLLTDMIEKGSRIKRMEL
jgi:hypothetical protein